MKKNVKIIFLIFIVIAIIIALLLNKNSKENIFLEDKVKSLGSTSHENINDQNNKSDIENNFEEHDKDKVVYHEDELKVKTYKIITDTDEKVKIQAKMNKQRSSSLVTLDLDIETEPCISYISGVSSFKKNDENQKYGKAKIIQEYSNKNTNFTIHFANGRRKTITDINLNDFKVFNSKPKKPEISINLPEGRMVAVTDQLRIVATNVADDENDRLKYIWKGRLAEYAQYTPGQHKVTLQVVDEWGEKSEVAEASFEVKEIISKRISFGNKTVPIPTNFYYVGGNLDTGVIISDNSEDEDKAQKLGQEWSITGDPNQELSHNAAEKLKGNQFVWIPQESNRHKGFYVGRYEAGIGEDGKSEEITSQANHIPIYKEGLYIVKSKVQSMYNRADINIGITVESYNESVLEEILKYIEKDVGNDKYKADREKASTWGNVLINSVLNSRGKYKEMEKQEEWKDATGYSTRMNKGDLLTTGSSNFLHKKHIYNIAGNLDEYGNVGSYRDSEKVWNPSCGSFGCYQWRTYTRYYMTVVGLKYNSESEKAKTQYSNSGRSGFSSFTGVGDRPVLYFK